MKEQQQLIRKTCLLMSAASLTGSLRAATIAPLAAVSPAQTIASVDGTFNIQESVGLNGVEYHVDVITSVPIYAVAISYVDDGTNYADALGSLSSIWTGNIVSETMWNNPNVSYAIGVPGATSPLILSTSALGSFDSIFGTDDNMVALYHTSNTPNTALDESNDSDQANWPTDTATFFRNSTILASEAIIIDQTGAIVGRTIAIPEPSGVFLLSLSSLSLLASRRR